jgi:hypothetical protein
MVNGAVSQFSPCPPLSSCGLSPESRQSRTAGQPARFKRPGRIPGGSNHTPANRHSKRSRLGGLPPMKAIKPYIGTVVLVLVTLFVVFKVLPMNVKKAVVG